MIIGHAMALFTFPRKSSWFRLTPKSYVLLVHERFKLAWAQRGDHGQR